MHMNVYPKPEQQKMELLRVTPEVAKRWLLQAARNRSNFRNINQQRLQALCALINRRGWWDNGSSFKFDIDGNLIDGQHRATVIITLGITVWAWVLTGLPPEVSGKIDPGGAAGVLRTTVQHLQRINKPWYHQLGSALYYLNAHLRGKLDWPQNSKGTMEEDLELLAEHPEIERSVALAAPSRIGMAGPIAMLHYVASQSGHKSAADEFVRGILIGANLGENDPVKRFRDRMIADKSSKAHLPPREKIALLIVAWNAWSHGRELRALSWHGIGPKASAFPDIVMPDVSDSQAA